MKSAAAGTSEASWRRRAAFVMLQGNNFRRRTQALPGQSTAAWSRQEVPAYGVRGDVIPSTFDEPAACREQFTEMMTERAKHLLGHKRDVVVPPDSITAWDAPATTVRRRRRQRHAPAEALIRRHAPARQTPRNAGRFSCWTHVCPEAGFKAAACPSSVGSTPTSGLLLAKPARWRTADGSTGRAGGRLQGHGGSAGCRPRPRPSRPLDRAGPGSALIPQVVFRLARQSAASAAVHRRKGPDVIDFADPSPGPG